MKLGILIFFGVGVFIIFNSMKSASSTNIRNAVLDEVKKYPELEIQDLYKLAYQAAMGNEHIMADTIRALKYLREELSSVEASGTEPLIELLRSDSAMARVNLRSFKAQKYDAQKLFSAMLKTAIEFKPSLDMLKIFLRDIEKLAEDKKLPFKKSVVSNYFKEMEKNNYPPMHHSKKVQEKYKPSYRIISGKEITFK